MNSTHILQNEKSAQFVWTGFILLFFLVQAIVWAIAISITSGDSSHAVVAGYDEDALKWDMNKKIQQASDSLGWKLNIDIKSDADVKGNRSAVFSITDANGKPVRDASLNVRAFHCGHAANSQALKFNEASAGEYHTTLRTRYSGQWQFEGFAEYDANLLMIDKRISINAKGR